MTYHYHTWSTEEAYNDLREILPARTTDRWLELQNTGEQRCIFSKLSKVEYTHPVDAVLRIIAALYPSMLFRVCDVRDKPLHESWENAHSNFRQDHFPISEFVDRSKQVDSLFRLQKDLRETEKYTEVLIYKKAYNGLVPALGLARVVIDAHIKDEGIVEGEEQDPDDALKPLTTFKILLADIEQTRQEGRLNVWQAGLYTVAYTQIRRRLARIAYYAGVPA
jgi:hypothetical protein